MAATDAACWPLAFGFVMLIEGWPTTSGRVIAFAAIGAAAQLGCGFVTGLYRRRFLPFSFEEIGVTACTIGLAGWIVLLIDLASDKPRVGHAGVWATATAAAMILGLRYARRYRARWIRSRTTRSRLPVVVVGAGDGATRAIRAMISSPISPYRPVALLDDDPAKRSLSIMGVRVKGRFDDLEQIARQVGADTVILAIPSASAELLRRLHKQAEVAGLQTLVLPPVQQLVGTGSTAELRKYSDEEVLNRGLVTIDMDAVGELIVGRRVLITGAGGSIGSELARQVILLKPKVLALLDHDDSLLHSVHQPLKDESCVFPVLADIRDIERLREVFALHAPEVVFHAAALKHVPALEAAPTEGWKTNVVGTSNVLSVAQQFGTTRFVNISTDKAADPVSVLGRTKQVAEQLTAGLAQRTGHHYVSVRFGNVIGSRGSVMETFQSQIDAGGPVTVTHQEVTRFFMAVREAVRLTLQAATMGKPGEVLVLDMGLPVSIVDVARQLIEQSGRSIEIQFTGLRPGEKLHEVLLGRDEHATRPHHPMIDHVQVPAMWPLDPDELRSTEARTLATAVIPGYAAEKPYTTRRLS